MRLPYARKLGLSVRRLPDETLVYDLDAFKAHCLNPTATLVWDHCDGRTTVGDMVDRLKKDNGAADAALVELALEQLSKRNLLQERVPVAEGPERVHRRDALRKLVAAAVAVPLIMTLKAPRAHAQASPFFNSCVPFVCLVGGVPNDALCTNQGPNCACVPVGASALCRVTA